MSPLETFGTVLILCAVLSVLALKLSLLTRSGSAASFIVGVFIGWFGSINWLIVLIAFTILGFIVTRYRIQVKEGRGLQEGRRGERTHRNVLANGLVPAMIALISYAVGHQADFVSGIAFLSSISVAAADTTASELGVLSDRTKLITTLEKVPPGTDGGVSAFGTSWAILAAVFASVIGWLIILPGQAVDARILIPVSMGFLGCMVDSVIGATLERRKLVSKLGNNIISMATGSALAVIILLLL